MLSIILPRHREPDIHEFIASVEDRFPRSEIIVSNDSESKGKGWTIRRALAECSGEDIAFLDGDGDIHPRMLLRLVPFLEDFDVVVGSKRITKSPLRRKIMTRLTRIWFKFLFGVKVDTQTGIKLFRRDALDMMGNYWESNGFIFDVEIIATMQKLGLRIIEVPIEAEIKKQVTFKTIFRIFGESLWLKYRFLFPRKK